ncbi:MAG: hypothetical protein UHS49_00840 [Faecalimonas sp.]|nr:hypothetical protein [Faecalimonas sp.]
MKVKKGDAGYLKQHKRNAIIKAILEFAIVFALLLLGVMQTKSRMNWLTIVAVLGCLPASKALVEVIMAVPHRSIATEIAAEIAEKTEALTVVYDLVLTSEKKIMPIACVAISGNTIIGYASNPKTDIEFAAKHIKQLLYANQFTKVTVKIFDDYLAFLTRAEALQNLATSEKADTKRHEDAIKNVILNLSI